MRFNLSKIDNIEIDGVDHNDYPDYCDAYICAATYKGIEMTQEELECLNQQEVDFVYEKVIESVF